MNEREYKAEIEALKKRIEELENVKIEAARPPHPHFKPEDKNEYFEILSTGLLSANIWSDSSDYCMDAYDIGNVFRTTADAGFAAERLRVLKEMREWAGKWNDPYTLCYMWDSTGSDIAVVFGVAQVVYSEIRFATKEDAENCIKAVGRDRLIKYYFGVKDNDP